MEDIKSALAVATGPGEHVGRLIAGLAVLREACGEVLLIVEGEDAQRIATDGLGVSFRSITRNDRPLVPFEGLEEWWNRSGSPCVAFATGGRQALFAPAKALDAEDIATTVRRFADGWSPGSEIVYLSDLDRSLGASGEDGLEVVDDVLHVLGAELPIADMAWAEAEGDGDGNDYLHIVMTDGRYRRVALGDLGR